MFTPLVLKLTQFSGSYINNKTVLQWAVSNNELVQKFSVERSKDGTNFVSVNSSTPSNKSGLESYQYSEIQSEARIYYRIKILDKQGSIHYSSVASITTKSQSASYLKVLNVSGSDDLLIGYYSNKNDVINVHLYTSPGSSVYSEKIKVIEGMNILSIPGNIISRREIYFLVAVNQDYDSFKAKISKFDYAL